MTLIILQKWQIEAPFSLWGDWVPNKQTKKKKKRKDVAETNSFWFSSLVLGAPGGRTGWIMRNQHQVLGSSHVSTRHPSELKSGLSFVSVYLARSLAIILLFISQRRWARLLICTLGLVGGGVLQQISAEVKRIMFTQSSTEDEMICAADALFLFSALLAATQNFSYSDSAMKRKLISFHDERVLSMFWDNLLLLLWHCQFSNSCLLF